MKKAITILILFGFLFLNFGFAGSSRVILAQEKLNLTETPTTTEGAKKWLENIWELIKEKLPGTLKKIWNEEILPVWQKMGDRAKNIWNSYLYPRLENIWQKIKSVFGEEIEERKPIIEKEFEKEKEEMKGDAPKVGKSLWERFKELIR